MKFNFIRGLNTKPKTPMIVTDDNLIYTTGGTLVVMNKKNKQQKILPIHDKTITAFDFNFSNGQIATGQLGTDDYKEKKAFIAIIDIGQMKLVKYLMDFNFGIEDLKFSPCGKFLAVHGWDFQLIVYKTSDYSRLLTLKQERIYPEITWNEQNSVVEQTCFYLIESKKIRQFSLSQNKDSFKENMKILQNKEFRNYDSPVFDSANKCLVTGTIQGEIVVFMQNNIHQTLFKKVSQSPVLCIKKFNNKYFCVTQNQQLIEFVVKPNGLVDVIEVTQLKQQPFKIFCSQKNFYLLNKEGNVMEVDLPNKSMQTIIEQPCEDIIDCVYDQKKQKVFQFLANGNLNTYTTEGKLINTFKNDTHQNTLPQKMHYDQNDNILTLAYQNGDIFIYNMDGFQQKGFISKSHKGLVQSIHRNKKFLLTCCDQSLLRIWSTKNYKLVHEFNYHSKAVTFCSAFGSESEMVISASKDRQLIVFDLKRERKLKTFQIQNGFVRDVVILDNNKFLTVGHNTPLSLWDINSNYPLKTIEEECKNLKLKIQNSKQKFAVLTESGEINIYSTSTMEKLQSIRVSYNGVFDIFWVNQNEIIFIEQTGAFGRVTLN